ncbi:MAG: hypothetical protein COT35_07540 [Nitrospirae bacterium CG08_land_8_20_14_0_20_52_24]|nr:MAG: hypothetical protein COT35_07540 [Nitrospirae bacterium CG08_land_8_20_14_0_20_52_24]PIV83041.1 MAG: hypothetical protein COW52_10375 [Nitrospirae bacterium CG17_big_fil_post_rev_8_21_14_2_50_50_9]PIW84300.1 MAG: hypothetical protein COZ95_10520 [Nitrospirae bacterium CG_4_8_14_3_um_filter_50_41]PIX85108.1 MAG: hypothetical protein COZ32_10205 [Nitrospirae bacterium CG_4_10_14_3_um_filter_53_41]
MIKRLVYWSNTVGFAVLLACVWLVDSATAAVPQISRTEVTDVTPYSFSVVWLSHVPATADVKIYSDAQGQNQIAGEVKVEPIPLGNGFEHVKESAENRGVLKARVGRLLPSTTYYFRTVTYDKAKPDDFFESNVMGPVNTAQVIQRTTVNNQGTVPVSNELILFGLMEADGTPAGEGSLLILQVTGCSYPITGYVGDGVAAPQVLVNLNNAYGADLRTKWLPGKERIRLKELRSGSDCVLTHFRLAPVNAGKGGVGDPMTGANASGILRAKADINVDASVNIQDFSLFATQFGSHVGECFYNVDYDFDGDTKVDVSDFSFFAAEYGNTYQY